MIFRLFAQRISLHFYETRCAKPYPAHAKRKLRHEMTRASRALLLPPATGHILKAGAFDAVAICRHTLASR
ncbi:hypothetical protein C0Z17_02580 [Trinickia caryophylli]|nr:hypothetical protein C0Z17_02580 [Trinickia caryophylli]